MALGGPGIVPAAPADEPSLSSTPTMTQGGPGIVPAAPADEPSLSSEPTMTPGRDASTMRPSTLGCIDQYELIRKLGGGGFGVVYLARDTVSRVEVALKTLHPLMKSNAEEMERLREKFALVSRLSHPNIAKALVLHPVREIAIADEEARRELRLVPGDSVMVMDYAPGITLSRWRRQFGNGVVPLPLALEIGRQIAAALDYAHGERIVHRDIKPSNVVVETLSPQPHSKAVSGLRVRILDFGLAAEIRSSMSRMSTETGDTSGTRPYMAPEQWLGRKQDGRADQYALACVLYELISGEPPFAGVFETGDPAAMRMAVEHDVPARLEGLPRHVNDMLRKALSKRPQDRFDSCGGFVSALGGTGRFRKWRVMLAAAGVVAAVAGLWFAIGKDGRANGRTSSPSEPPPVEAPTSLAPATPARQAAPPHQVEPSAAPESPISQNRPEPAHVASVPALPAAPADDAPLGDWEDYLFSLKERRQSLLDEGYLESGEQVKAVAAAIAAADGRIAALTASIEDNERKARIAKAHKDAERASNRARIAEIRRNVERKVATAAKYDGVDDKPFVERRKTIAEATNRLDGISDPDEIETVKRLRIDIDDAVDWILRNGPAREGIASQEKELKALEPELERVGAAKLAAQSFNAARRQERESANLRDKADYEGAADGYRQTKDLYEKAIAEAKTAQSEASAVRADGLKAAGLWADCLKAADEALEWDAGNAKAQTLKREAQGVIDAERKAKEEAERRKREAEEAAQREREAKAAAEKAERERQERERQERECQEREAEEAAQRERETKAAAEKAEREQQERERQEAERRKREAEEAARMPDAGDLKTVTVGSQTIRLHWCPAGSFTMGSPSGEKDRFSNETQHRVTLSRGFWMGETEVTQGLWKEVMGTTVRQQRDKADKSWGLYGEGDNYPMYYINWDECQEFVRKLNSRPEVQRSGLKFALPTEAQWEYACRAGTTTAYSYGDSANDAYMWYNRRSQTHPVGEKRANAWGLHDMHGNVWEWCQDWYGPYPSGVQTDSPGASSGSSRVNRGGSYWDVAWCCRSAFRNCNNPGRRFNFLGLRLVAVQDFERKVKEVYAGNGDNGNTPKKTPRLVCDGEKLSLKTQEQIREYVQLAIAELDMSLKDNRLIKEKVESGEEIKVHCPTNGMSISLISDMGIAPAMYIDKDGELHLAYGIPTLEIIGSVEVDGRSISDDGKMTWTCKVFSGVGNRIVAKINPECVHLLGAEKVAELEHHPKEYPIERIDLSKYLEEGTKGEFTITISSRKNESPVFFKVVFFRE